MRAVQLVCVRTLVLCIYACYGGAEGREEETFWRQENFGWAQIPQLIVCSMVRSVLASSVDNESWGGSACSLNHLILTVKNMNMTNDTWVWDCWFFFFCSPSPNKDISSV